MHPVLPMKRIRSLWSTRRAPTSDLYIAQKRVLGLFYYAWLDSREGFAVYRCDHLNEVMQPVHNRLTTVLEPRDYAEYLAFSTRPSIHLLWILPSAELRARRFEKPVPIPRSKLKVDPQISLFGSE
jgi:hypothetical protein